MHPNWLFILSKLVFTHNTGKKYSKFRVNFNFTLILSNKNILNRLSKVNDYIYTIFWVTQYLIETAWDEPMPWAWGSICSLQRESLVVPYTVSRFNTHCSTYKVLSKNEIHIIFTI